ncbi:cytochrome P450 6A1-like [Lycorma delicatula]|uniref:cytochrome P450 6A1-like n=1 Tax=Lycorma delicatula TaxID=130591 RepID=UPI003F5188AD
MAVSFIFDGLWVNVAIVFAVLFAIMYVFSVYHFTYWKSKGIPYISGTFPFGSIGNVVFQKTSLTEIFLDFYNKAKNEKYIGFYSFLEPQIVIKDLAIIKNVLVKDFSNFVDRGVYFNEAVDPLSAHLFAIEGLKWKNLRAKLSPTFTSSKMKKMFSTAKECAVELKNYVEKLSSKGDIDFKDVTGRYGLDVISSVALGLEGNNFKNENTDLRKVANMFSAPSTLQMFRFTLTLSAKFIAKLMQMRFVPKAVEDYYMHVVKENTEYRENNNIKRDDFMQLLIDLKNNKEFQNNGELKKDNQVNLTLEEMAAQSFVFVVGGFETTSVTLGFCLYELALNPHIQDKLIDELDEAGSDLSYDVLNQLPYLDMVVSETLRKYPPVPTLQRQCLKDYTLPDGKIIKKGTLVVISVIGMHLDPKLFPNPEEFDPERFSKENIHKIQPYSYLPFGEGPRICIGMRFGKMQIKLAIATLLSRFKFETSVKTPIPIKIEKKTITYNAEGGMWLQVIQRKK